MLFRKDERDAREKRADERRSFAELEAKVDSMGNTVRHSRPYHDYFEGYSEEMEKDACGRNGKITRVYAGRYFEYTGHLSAAAVRALNLGALLAACLLMLPLFALGGAAGSSFLVFLPGTGALLLLIAGCYNRLVLLFSPARMRLYEYRLTHERLPSLCRASSGCLLAASAGCIAATAIAGDAFSGELLRAVLCCAAGAAILLLQAFSERKTVYREIPASAAVEGNAVLIE